MNKIDTDKEAEILAKCIDRVLTEAEQVSGPQYIWKRHVLISDPLAFFKQHLTEDERKELGLNENPC